MRLLGGSCDPGRGREGEGCGDSCFQLDWLIKSVFGSYQRTKHR
ncbi:mCG1032902, partial [Mus musculus]